MTKYYVLIIISLTALMVRAQLPSELNTISADIFTKKLLNNDELVVVVGPARSNQAIKEVFARKSALTTSLSTTLSLEFRSPNNAPLCLWSSMFTFGDAQQHREFRVFDILIVENRVVLALGIAGGFISIVEISPFSHEQKFVSLPPADWSLLEVLVPIKDGRIKVELIKETDQGLIEVKITDSIDAHVRQSHFKQKSGAWFFEPVKGN